MATAHDVTPIVTADGGYAMAEVANRDSNGNIIATYYASKSDTYTKKEIDAKLTSAVRYKGSVATYADLPTSGQAVGDMYNVAGAYGITPAGTNWAWNGTAWDPLGGTVDLSNFATNSYVNATFLTVSNASSTYLTISNASSTYLTKTSASSTYLPISSASSTYVPKTTTVNGHALSANVSVTKSDVGLGNVVDAPQIAIPQAGSTAYLTSGGAYNYCLSFHDGGYYPGGFSYIVGSLNSKDSFWWHAVLDTGKPNSPTAELRLYYSSTPDGASVNELTIFLDGFHYRVGGSEYDADWKSVARAAYTTYGAGLKGNPGNEITADFRAGTVVSISW